MPRPRARRHRPGRRPARTGRSAARSNDAGSTGCAYRGRKQPWRPSARHCEERSDEAIQSSVASLDCFASLAMTQQCFDSVMAISSRLHRLAVLELDLRRLQLGLAVGAEIEKVLLRKPERGGEQ